MDGDDPPPTEAVNGATVTRIVSAGRRMIVAYGVLSRRKEGLFPSFLLAGGDSANKIA